MSESNTVATEGTAPVPESEPVPATVAAPRLGAARILTIVGVVVALALAVWLRFFRIDDPMGGFHAYNEGFYVRLALADANRSFFAWFSNPLDVNNPPLYGVIVSFFFRFLQPSIEVARSVSAVASLATMGVVWRLGEELFDRRTGIIAAIFLGLMPGVVLVSHNAQVDAVLVLCMFSTVLAWVLSAKDDDWRWAVVAGIALGLGVLTKLPAVIVLPGLFVWECARTRGVRWLISRRVAVFAGAILLVGVPWFAMRVITASAAYVSDQSGIATAAAAFINGLASEMLTEPFWLFSAPVLIAVAFGIVTMVRARTLGDLLVAVELVTVLAFLTVFHFHTYYWLPAAPLVALIAARGFGSVSGVTWVRVSRMALLVVLLCGTLLCAVMLMSGSKWGAWSPIALGPLVEVPGGRAVVEIAVPLYDNTYGPVADVYLPRGTAVRGETTATAGLTALYSLQAPDPATPSMPLTATSVRPVLFGYELHQTPPRTHFFQNGPWVAEKTGPLWQFGLVSREVAPPIALYDISGTLLR